VVALVDATSTSAAKAWCTGFLTNIGNPKAADPAQRPGSRPAVPQGHAVQFFCVVLILRPVKSSSTAMFSGA
jgi:hypothetical protein